MLIKTVGNRDDRNRINLKSYFRLKDESIQDLRLMTKPIYIHYLLFSHFLEADLFSMSSCLYRVNVSKEKKTYGE